MIYNLKRNVFSERIYNKQFFLISKKLKPVVIIITLLIFTSVQNVSGCTDPDANFSVDNATPVVGQTVTFTNTSANNDGTINSWSWDFGSGASPATATGVGPHQVSYSATGFKTVALTVSWPANVRIDAGSNTETKTNFINVSPVPCPTITASVTGKTDVSCNAGADGTITVSASGGVAPYSYSVNNGTGWTASPANPYTFTNLVANEVYKIRVKDANGCESPVIP